MRPVPRNLVIGCAAVLSSYAAYVLYAWQRYGRPAQAAWWGRDELLDRFIPIYDVVERHRVRVDAPPDVVLRAACEQELDRLPLVRAIFKGRELLLGSTADAREHPRGLLAQTTALGWVVLEETPGREVVVGAVTKPWEADVTFRSIPPGQFAAFDEPGYVKIVWTLRADPVGPGRSIFRTETRAVATDADARRRFRRYWAFLSPGIIGIRWRAAARLRADFRRRRVPRVPNLESAVQHR